MHITNLLYSLSLIIPFFALRGWLSDNVAPVFATLGVGETRKYHSLHAGIYAGKHKGSHYVIETGGNLGCGVGMVSARKLEDVFEEDANFFVLSPPKDSRGAIQ